MSLKIIRPTVITDAMLVDSNVPINDYPVYSPDEAYSTGERVINGYDIYESLADENQGNEPSHSPDKWLSPGMVNRWRAFDDKISSRTEQSNLISYRLKTSKAVNFVGVLNVAGATEITVRVEDTHAGVVYTHTENVRAITPKSGWWQWFYGQREARNQALFSNLPAYPRAEICIEIKGGQSLGVGLIILGQMREIGIGVEWGARGGFTSYSRVRRDPETGEVDYRKGRSSNRSTLNLVIKTSDFDMVKNYMRSVDGVPVLIVPAEQFSSFTDYGLIKHFEPVLQNVSTSMCSIEFDGFI